MVTIITVVYYVQRLVNADSLSSETVVSVVVVSWSCDVEGLELP